MFYLNILPQSKEKINSIHECIIMHKIVMHKQCLKCIFLSENKTIGVRKQNIFAAHALNILRNCAILPKRTGGFQYLHKNATKVNLFSKTP